MTTHTANSYPYDIIGDIHGHADELERLLKKLDYKESDGAFQKSTSTDKN